MSDTIEKTVNLQTGPSHNVAKRVKKFRRPKKVNKLLCKEEIERKKKLANIVHKKVTTSTNWKHFIEQKLHMENESGADSTIEEKKKVYTGTFRKNRKALATSVVNKTEEKVIGLAENESSCMPRQSSSQVESSKSRTGPRPATPSKTINQKLTRFIGIDCEMVGVDDDYGKDSMLARVSLVNKFGECIYDKFVKPKEDVLDYRTHVSGVRPIDLKDAECFETVQKEVAEIIKGRVLVGHGLHNDLKVLYLSHPRRRIRDTSKYEKFRQINNGRTPSLKKLAATILGVTIQEGEHDPVTDAKAAIQLYMMYQKEWEAELRAGKGIRSKSKRSFKAIAK